MSGKPRDNKLLQKITPEDRVLIISPHPDDDVIGMGGTMDLLPNKDRVRVLYMTNGGSDLRIKEALSALKILGYSKDSLMEGDMPFY